MLRGLREPRIGRTVSISDCVRVVSAVVALPMPHHPDRVGDAYPAYLPAYFMYAGYGQRQRQRRQQKQQRQGRSTWRASI